MDAKAAVPKAQLGTAKLTKKMFVGGTGELTDEDFREHFSQYGDIEDAAVSRGIYIWCASMCIVRCCSQLGLAECVKLTVSSSPPEQYCQRKKAEPSVAA